MKPLFVIPHLSKALFAFCLAFLVLLAPFPAQASLPTAKKEVKEAKAKAFAIHLQVASVAQYHFEAHCPIVTTMKKRLHYSEPYKNSFNKVGKAGKNAKRPRDGLSCGSQRT
jgi:hypothetical protein